MSRTKELLIDGTYVAVQQQHPTGAPVDGASLIVSRSDKTLVVNLDENEKCDVVDALKPRMYQLFWIQPDGSELTRTVTSSWSRVTISVQLAPSALRSMSGLRLNTWVDGMCVRTKIWHDEDKRPMTQEEVAAAARALRATTRSTSWGPWLIEVSP